MTTLKDYNPSPPKVLLAGEMGTGKTLLATTPGARALVLDLNNGLTSCRLFKDKFTADRLSCEVKQCWELGKPGAAFSRTLAYVQEFAKKPSHEMLVIDGLDDLADGALASILVNASKWDEKSVDKVTRTEWGAAIALVERVMYRIKSLPTVVVMTAHTKLVEVDGNLRTALAVYGRNLGGKLEGMFDEVWCTKVTGSGAARKFLLQTISTGGIKCKTRHQLQNDTDMNLGLVEILSRVGYKWQAKPSAP